MALDILNWPFLTLRPHPPITHADDGTQWDKLIAIRRRIPEAVLERDYCLAWFLVGLARSPLKEKLAFKGGTALRRCHFDYYRFSEDLDFTFLTKGPWQKQR